MTNPLHVERRRNGFRDAKELWVGGLVVCLLLATLGLSYGGGELHSGPGFSIKTVFNRIDGLAEGDEVRMGGVRIGSVERMGLDEYYRAEVLLRLAPGTLIPTDSSAAIHTDGLFGSKFVVLEPGGEEEYLGDGAEITFTQDAVIVSELLELIIGQGRQALNKRKDGETN